MVWLLVTLLLHAHANTVLIQAAQSRPLDYKAVLKAHPEYSSPTQNYLSSHPLPAEREKLIALFAEAQRSFLQKSNEEVRSRFVEVTALITREDWEKSDREIFLQSYLRLAQMESDIEARDRWLGQSISLGDVSFDASLYPPPLLARRVQMIQQLPKKDVAGRLRGLGWSVLINGHLCTKSDCANWPLYPGPVRVTVLSDQWLPQSAVIDPAELDRFTPPTIAWSGGTCDNVQLHAEAEKFPEKKVFWNLDCEKPKAALNLKPVNVPPPVLADFTSTAPKPTPFYQSKWFWIGAGAAAVAVAIAVGASQKKETQETSTSYGY